MPTPCAGRASRLLEPATRPHHPRRAMDADGRPTAEQVHRTVEAVWRIEAGRLIAALARITGDVGTAEEMAQEALVAALEHWPRAGVPPNPAAWLMTTAKNRAIDGHRRRE